MPWYHGTSGVVGELGPLYLTGSSALARLNAGPRGHLLEFEIDPAAVVLDMQDPEAFVHSSMDTIGYNPQEVERLAGRGIDVVWDSDDYQRGFDQVFVVNPEVLQLVGGEHAQ